MPVFCFFLKRVVDTVTAATILAVSAPLLAIIALVIKLESPGTVLYRAQRVGLKGRRFRCYKFRTMNAGADKLTAGTGRDYLFGAAGNDVLTARGKVAFVNGGKGHNIAYVKNRAMASFARKHGTKKVHII